MAMRNDMGDAFAHAMKAQAEAMRRSEQFARQRQQEQERARRDSYTPDQLRDATALGYMKGVKLKPGQMLLLGPRSIDILTGSDPQGKLPDRFVIDKSEWSAT